MKRSIELKSKGGLKGSYVIRTFCSDTGKLLWESNPIENLIVSGSGGYGRNLVIRQLAGDATYQLEVDSASIGTGTNTPTDADTGLQTPVLASIPIADVIVSNDSVLFRIFITNAQLANGTYNEFGLFSNLRLFARSIISPAFVKGSNQNTSVDYTISLT